MANTESLESQQNEPWYRQFWPWFIIFFPASAVIAGIATIIIAVQTDDGLVQDDYYKAGLAINEQLDREQLARDLNLLASAKIDLQTQQISLSLTGKNPIQDQRLLLKLVHPTLAGRDLQIPLQLQTSGDYQGLMVVMPLEGRWHAILEPENKKWRLYGETKMPLIGRLELKP